MFALRQSYRRASRDFAHFSDTAAREFHVEDFWQNYKSRPGTSWAATPVISGDWDGLRSKKATEQVDMFGSWTSSLFGLKPSPAPGPCDGRASTAPPGFRRQRSETVETCYTACSFWHEPTMRSMRGSDSENSTFEELPGFFTASCEFDLERTQLTNCFSWCSFLREAGNSPLVLADPSLLSRIPGLEGLPVMDAALEQYIHTCNKLGVRPRPLPFITGHAPNLLAADQNLTDKDLLSILSLTKEVDLIEEVDLSGNRNLTDAALVPFLPLGMSVGRRGPVHVACETCDELDRTCLTSLNLSFCALGAAALDLLAQLLLKGGFLARGLPQGLGLLNVLDISGVQVPMAAQQRLMVSWPPGPPGPRRGVRVSMAVAPAAFLTNFGLIALGCVLRNLDCLREDDGRAALRLALYVTLPTLVFCTFSSPPQGVSGSSALPFAPVCSLLGFAVAAAGAWLSFAGRKADASRTLLIGMATGVNLAMFAYPIIEGAYGPAGLRIAAIFDLPNMLVNFAYNRAIFATLSTKKRPSPQQLAFTTLLQLLFFPPLAAIWLGLTLRATGVALPAWLMAILGDVAAANKVLVLLALGILLRPRFDAAQREVLLALLTVRYALMLSVAAAVTVAGAAAGVPPTVRAVVVSALCCPIPAVSVQYAAEAGCDSGLAAAMANATNIISFALMFWVAALRDAPPHVLAGCLATGAVISLACARLVGVGSGRFSGLGGAEAGEAGDQARQTGRRALRARPRAGVISGTALGAALVGQATHARFAWPRRHPNLWRANLANLGLGKLRCARTSLQGLFQSQSLEEVDLSWNTFDSAAFSQLGRALSSGSVARLAVAGCSNMTRAVR
ncbi:unnamed protein product, partial [Effrenium voratum]